MRGDRGQTLVEFALAATVFFMTLFGLISFGLAVWQYNMVANLAQEGARWASVRGSTSKLGAATNGLNGTVDTYVKSRALGMSLDPTLTSWPEGSNDPGKRVQVRVQKKFKPFTSFIPNATLTLQSTAQMIIAR